MCGDALAATQLAAAAIQKEKLFYQRIARLHQQSDYLHTEFFVDRCDTVHPDPISFLDPLY